MKSREKSFEVSTLNPKVFLVWSKSNLGDG